MYVTLPASHVSSIPAANVIYNYRRPKWKSPATQSNISRREGEQFLNIFERDS